MLKPINDRLLLSTETLTPLDYGAGVRDFGLCKNIIEVDDLRRAYYLGHEASRCKFYGEPVTVVIAPWHHLWHTYVFGR